MVKSHRAKRAIAWTAAVVIACAVLLLAVALFALPALEQRPRLLARWLGEYLEREVTLREFELVWSDGAPLLRIRGLGLSAGNALRLDTAEVRIDALRSIRELRIRPRSVVVRGAQVHVTRAANGAFVAEGFGQRGSTTADGVLTNLLATLPADAVLGIEQATVTIKGPGTQSNPAQPLVLFPVSAHLYHGDQGVRISATAALRDFPQAPIRATVHWRDRKSSPLEAAEFTINTQALPVSALPQNLRPVGVTGQINFAADGHIADRMLHTMRGTLNIEQISVPHDTAATSVNAIQSLIEYVHNDAEWRLTLLRLHTKSAEKLSTPSTFTLRGKLQSAPHSATLDHMPVSTLLPVLRILVPASDTLSRATRMLSTAGRIENLQLDLDGDLSAIRVRQLRVQMRDVVLKSEDYNLEAGPLDASLVTLGQGGSIDMQAAPIALRASAGGRALTRFVGAGTLRWRDGEDELLIDTDGVTLADGELRMQLSGALRIPRQESANTIVDLHLHGAGLDEQSLQRYLALELLPVPLSEWLSTSITSIQLSEFSAHIAGSSGSVVAMTELLELEAAFENATLHYLDGWPDITAMSGRFALSAKKFSFNIDSARASGARIVSGRGQIADVLAEHPLITLQGRATGRTEQGTAFINATPLARKFAPLMRELSAKGKAALALKLKIPLSDAATEVHGELKLNNNKLRIQALRSALSGVKGAIVFDAKGLTEATLTANYLQREIKLSLDGMLDKRNRTRLTIDGVTDPQGLLRHLYDVGALPSDQPSVLPIIGRLSGRTNWQVTMDLVQADGNDQIITMAVRSDLKGMALNLPAPLGKSTRESRPLSVTSTLAGAAGGNRRFQVRYGDALHAILEMAPQQPDGFALHRGALHLGGGDATLTLRRGISVSGAVAVISVDEWARLIVDFGVDFGVDSGVESGAKADTNNPPPRALDRVRQVRLQAQRLIALGASFDDVQLDVAHDERGPWLITTKGTGIDGTISVTEPIGHAPIEARFKRLHVRPDNTMQAVDETAEKFIIDPASVPAAKVVVQHLRYNDIELGLAKLVLQPTDDGLALREIFALSDAFELRGAGNWSGPADDAQSRFDLRLHSNDFGQFANALGYGDSGIEGGAAEIAISASWSGSPFDFALDQIKGELHFRATRGWLRAIEPGTTGRVFGLFNLSILPRRLLLLDFKDLFEEGIGYELAEGSIALSDGNATTENVIMQTATAQVEIKGRVGLIDEDYDQVMTITPKMSASFPLAPIWLAEKLLNRKLIDSAFSYQYLITGSWDEPQVERVPVEAPVREIR